MSQETLVDLTHPFNHQTIYWPTEHGFELEKRGGITHGYYYAANIFKAPEHGGTHIDAPLHFSKNGLSVDKIPLAQLKGAGCVIDVSSQVKDNADYLISKEDILTWESHYGSLSPEDIVFFKTGWERFWGNPLKYLGTDKKGDVDNLRFPGLSPEAASYLVSKKIKGGGVDTASLDPGQTNNYKAHRLLLGASIYGLENVANLDKLPPRGVTIIVSPMKIEGGTGAPVRILAIKP